MFHKLIQFWYTLPEMISGFLGKIGQPLAYVGFGFVFSVFSLFFLMDIIKKIKEKNSDQS